MKKKVKKEEKAEVSKTLLSRPVAFIHPPGTLWIDAVVFVVLLLATSLVNNFLYYLNFFSLLFVRFGSLLLLILVVATLVYFMKLIAHLGHGIIALKTSYRVALFILILLAALYIYLNQEYYGLRIIELIQRIPFRNIYPFTF